MFGTQMKILLKIAIFITGIWAAIRPAVYGFIFIIASDSSAIIDFLVLGSCIIIVWDAFKILPRLVWSASLLILLVATNIGFFHYFQDFGESGPLPYEWLNGYYKFSLPLIILAVLKCLFQLRFDFFKKATNVIENAEQRH
jgi:hypothetical protein